MPAPLSIMRISDLHMQIASSLASKATSLSLLVPVYNEEEAVPLFLHKVIPFAEKASLAVDETTNYEIVFVNDGSSDSTKFAIAAAAVRNPKIKLLNLSRNFGKEAALAAGLEHVSGKVVIPIDVDLQDPPELLEEMVRKWQAGARVVNARRIDRSNDTWLKRQTSEWFYRIYNRLAEYPISPNVGDFRLLDHEVVKTLRLLHENNRFSKGLFSWVGYDTATIEYERPPRVAGKTKWPYGRLWGLAVDGIVSSTTIPLRVSTWLGIVLGIFAGVYGLYVVIHTLLFGTDVPGYASLIATILFLGSFNLVSVGILGEYVGRIAREVRGRPNYIVESKIGFE
jgi:glycosyltransferase involved in cell wall biosynthesis